jgi:hypothetical protein
VIEKIGGRDRVRTCDPLLAKQVLSQLSYTPTVANAINSNASAAVREHRNPTICLIGLDSWSKARSLSVRFRYGIESSGR